MGVKSHDFGKHEKRRHGCGVNLGAPWIRIIRKHQQDGAQFIRTGDKKRGLITDRVFIREKGDPNNFFCVQRHKRTERVSGTAGFSGSGAHGPIRDQKRCQFSKFIFKACDKLGSCIKEAGFQLQFTDTEKHFTEPFLQPGLPEFLKLVPKPV